MVVQANMATLCPELLRCAYTWSRKSSLISLQEIRDGLEGATRFFTPLSNVATLNISLYFIFNFSLPFILIVQMFIGFSRMAGPYVTSWVPKFGTKNKRLYLYKTSKWQFLNNLSKNVINWSWDYCEYNIETQNSQDRDQEWGWIKSESTDTHYILFDYRPTSSLFSSLKKIESSTRYACHSGLFPSETVRELRPAQKPKRG